MVAYGEFRCAYNKDADEQRIVFYGMRYIIDQYVGKRWTREMVHQTEAFFATHMAPAYTSFPFPRDLFLKVRSNVAFYAAVCG